MQVVLLEVPAVNVTMDGQPVLDDFTLNHPKYPQLVLTSNLRAAGIDATFLDLKGGSGAESRLYGALDYCGRRLEMFRVGVPFEFAAEPLRGANIVGISANFTMERAVVAQTIEFLRALPGRRLIVVGGHDATADPAYYLRHGADLCVLGEGETALPEIARAMACGQSPAVQGTASFAGGVLRRGSRRPAHRYEDIAFPDTDLLRATHFDESPDGPIPTDVSARIAPIETSRGCGEACSFCDVTFVVGRYRPIPLAMIEQMISNLKAAGIRTLQIIDDNLLYRLLDAYEGTHGRQAILELFRLLYAEGFAWEFFNGFQLGLFEHDGVIDIELIETLYRSGKDGERRIGCFRSYVPLDKVTAEEMSLLKKLKPLHVAREVVRAIAQCGVPALALGFVIGSVRETPSTLDETATRAEELRAIVTRASSGRTNPTVLPLCSIPLPGTPDFHAFRDHISFSADEHPELYNVFMSVLRNEHFTPLELTLQRQRMRDSLNRKSVAADAHHR